MSGGHYTAMVKCEADNSITNTNSLLMNKVDSNGENGLIDIRARSTSSAHSAGANSIKDDSDSTKVSTLGSSLDTAWLCFDDDVVSAVPLHALESTIVSG